ncbi:MAG: penicillin acylase family protein [Alphaproteobacteria bacterium]|nr:penicillin acylase family protein [Alphaproteobacteria bacterium]MCB9698529.1 penicillin acylase family protein [Alphaproteobacteria bacterium]
MWWLLAPSCALVKLSSIGRSYPVIEGEIAVGSVPHAVTITRDVHGVPHARGETEADAWYALGFAHGQDRLFQADLSRRVAFGELTPWFGERAADAEAFMHLLDLRARAEETLARLDEPTRTMLEAYAAGVNDAATASKAAPIEYRLLGVEVEPWRPADSLGILYLFSWTLADNLDRELAAFELRDLERDTLDRLFRSSPLDPAIEESWDTVASAEVGAFTPEWDAFVGLLGGAPDQAQASNNWVVGPERSADGFPIVANDPHLHQAVPSLWYAADIAGGALHVAGATLPGIPGFPVGHDQRVAWGLTNIMADTVDVAVVKRDGELGAIVGGAREELQAVTVDGRTQYRTSIGPVITAIDAPYVMVMRWHALSVEDETARMLRELALARSVDEVLSASGRPMVVALNLVAADVDGDYAWQTVGSMVRRRGITGRVPYPAWEADLGWDGWLEHTPGERRPERGYVVSANSRPDDPMASELSTSYVPPHRFDRISELLAAQTSATPEDQQRIQLDRQEGDARTYRDALLEGVHPAGEDARRCLELLQRWDLVADDRSAGAAVWALFERDVVEEALLDDLGPDRTRVAMSVFSPGRSLLDADQLDGFVTDRPAVVGRALERTCQQLREALGPDPAHWTLGALHPLRLHHPFADRAPALLKSWNMTEVPSGGTYATVAAAGYSWKGAGELPVTGMASLRVVMPLSDLGASTLVHPGGQSGQPRDPLYTTHYPHFVADQTLPLWFDDEDVAAHAAWRLVLRQE